MKPSLKFLDIVIIIAVTLAATASFFLTRDKSGKELYAYVDSPQGQYIFSMENEGFYEIPGKIGTSIIHIKDKGLSFVQSPCPGQNCIHKGICTRGGEWNACLPNGIFIRIQGKNLELDGISQ